tara:strand:+ start:4727 stop:5212 length:486 start_codon:yes stop_codon:yes gene_type:complete
MIDNVEYSLIFKELGLLPIWKERLDNNNLKNGICFFQELIFDKDPVFFIALTNNKEKLSKQKLFENICNYLISISDKKTEKFKLCDLSDLVALKRKPKFVLLLADKNCSLGDLLLKQWDSSDIFGSKTSITEMIKNPISKEILWHDIQSLTNKIHSKNESI